MQFSTHSILFILLPLIVYVVGFGVCLAGYRKTKGKIYLYATFFFAVNILRHWNLPFARVYTHPYYGEIFLSVTRFINIGFMFLFLVAMGLLVWGFYLEAEGNAK